MKYCKCCGIEKDESFFYKNKNRKDGLNFYCKDCTNKKQKEYNEKTGKYLRDVRPCLSANTSRKISRKTRKITIYGEAIAEIIDSISNYDKDDVNLINEICSGEY